MNHWIETNIFLFYHIFFPLYIRETEWIPKGDVMMIFFNKPDKNTVLGKRVQLVFHLHPHPIIYFLAFDLYITCTLVGLMRLSETNSEYRVTYVGFQHW